MKISLISALASHARRARAPPVARARKTLPFKLPARLAVNRDAHACVDAIVRVIPPPCVRSTSSRGARRRCVPRRFASRVVEIGVLDNDGAAIDARSIDAISAPRAV